MELHNARYDGELKQYAERLAADPFFESHSVFTTAEARRMNDVLFALTVIVTMLSSYFNRDDDLDEFLARYNDSFGERADMQRRIRAVFAFVDACKFTSKRPWLKADLLTLLIEIDRALHRDKLKLDADEVGARLNSFYERVEVAAAGATRQARRGRVLPSRGPLQHRQGQADHSRRAGRCRRNPGRVAVRPLGPTGGPLSSDGA